MKISGPINTATTPGTTPRSSGPRSPRADAVAEGAETVRLSAASTALGDNGATVNQARVGEIRQAIAEGRFQINAGAIADRLIATARELVDSQKRG